MRTSSFGRVIVLGILAATMAGCVGASLGGSTNHFMWVATVGDQKVTAFSVNTTNGTASQVGSAVATGVTPIAMAMTPDAKTLFIANSGNGTISAYSINSDGSLKGAASAPSHGQSPVGLA